MLKPFTRYGCIGEKLIVGSVGFGSKNEKAAIKYDCLLN